MDYKQKYEEAIEQAKKELQTCGSLDCDAARQIFRFFPELKEKENKDERIRKVFRGWIYSQPLSFFDNGISKEEMLAWIEKQGEIKRSDYPYVPGWRENRPDNKPKIMHSILMLTTHGVAEGEWLGEEWCQYRWSCKVKDEDVLYWLHLSDLETLEKENANQDFSWLEKKGEQSNWKPSKDEMDALYGLAYITNKMDDRKDDAITKLYQDLKREFFNGATYENMFPSSPVDSANKVEPKFKVGDFIVSNYCIGKIIALTDDAYLLDSGQGIPFSCEHNAHLWTIQDAKDGDVLCSGQLIILFKQWEDNTDCTFIIAHAGIDISGRLQITNKHWLINNQSKPATKEERDLLFQKIKEAGYEWDAEKKELKKIEQNPTWTEEDEKQLNDIISLLPGLDIRHNWLKSLKERMKGE